jgi:eukaryotic-like serine/threonine-protein kinase
MAYTSGDVIDGRYEILGVIGKGAHGVVYQAKDQLLGSQVAVKCLHGDVASEPGFKTRMAREARAMGALSGTAATQVLAFGKTDDGGMFIAMELVRGRDFEAYLREIEGHGGRLGVPKLVELLGPIVDTLEAAHAISILHRDLKPGNIMVLDAPGRGPVRLLDFGLAKDLKADPLTADGMIAGSPGYMAPEVWRGKPDLLDHRIDVYSLGAIVFRALAGSPPFDPTLPLDKILIAVLRGARPSLLARRSELPEAIDAWVAKALAIKPEDRFQTPRELWSAFLTVVRVELGR